MAQQIGNLHRSRFARKRQQPIAGGVARQVDQDVDAVPADQFGEIFIA